jgi:hypothetical protein
MGVYWAVCAKNGKTGDTASAESSNNGHSASKDVQCRIGSVTSLVPAEEAASEERAAVA